MIYVEEGKSYDCVSMTECTMHTQMYCQNFEGGIPFYGHHFICISFVVAEYPWQFTTETEKNLEKWLYLPSYFDPPNVYKLIGMLH